MFFLVPYQTPKFNKKHPEKKKTKNWLMISIMKELSFLSQKKIIARLKNKIIFVLTCFVVKIKLFTHFTYLAKKFNGCMDLFLIFDENKSH